MQDRWKVLSLLIAMTLLTAACGLLRDPEQPSGTIQATPLALPTETTGPAATETSAPELPTEAPMEEATATQEAAGDLQVYSISPADSQVRFELDEDLRGQRNTVVGTTDQIAGEIAVNLSDLSSAQVGVIQVNARSLITDNNFRNRAIQNEILDTGEFEFITFEPTSLGGLPASAAIGEEISFTIMGDLTIRDVTQPVTFDVTATADSESRLSGTARAVVAWPDYGLSIPQVPNVANVEEEVDLILDFVASAVE